MFWILLSFILLLSTPALAQVPAVKITNYNSNSLPEWVEIQNQSDQIININNWLLKDDNTVTTDDLTLTGCLSAHSYQTFYNTQNWLNNSSAEKISLYDNNSILIDQLEYSVGKTEVNPQSTNTCVPSVTPTLTPSATSTPTNPPTPSNTATPSNTPPPTNTPIPTPTSSLAPSPSATRTPTPKKTPTPTKEPTDTPEPTAVIIPTPELPLTGGDIQGISDIIIPSPTTRVTQAFRVSSGLVPTLFIVLGGILLIVPIVITRLR